MCECNHQNALKQTSLAERTYKYRIYDIHSKITSLVIPPKQ